MKILPSLLPFLFASLFTLAPHAHAETSQSVVVDDTIAHLQTKWAEIKYGMADKKQQIAAIDALEAEAAEAVANAPQSAGRLIWQAIIMSTEAGIDGGVSALGKVKDAKKVLEKAEGIDATALDGSVYTSLGSLYYQVPGWPIGFGDDKKALAYLNKALAMNPDGIDPNYFYGDYLLNKGKYKDAIVALEKALQAPPRPNRESADAGRRQEIQVALDKAKKKAGGKTGS
jgi:tetratricopeptide (TPR) repeat protein